MHAATAFPDGDNSASQTSATSVCLKFAYDRMLGAVGLVSKLRFKRDDDHILTLFAQMCDPKPRHHMLLLRDELSG